MGSTIKSERSERSFPFFWVAACVLALLSTLTSTVTHAYPASHAPFAPGHAPNFGKLQPCKEMTPRPSGIRVGLRGEVHVHTVPDSITAPLVSVCDDTYTRNWSITVTDRFDRALSLPLVLHSSPLPPEVFHADLNRDGILDFMVAGTNMGNGLAASLTYVGFLLSNDGGYSSVYFEGFHFTPEDVVRFRKKGPWYFIYCDLVSSRDEQTRDGRQHNFWVYQVFEFDGGRMMETTRLASFPKWVWYTSNKNHQETRQLSAEQKRRILDLERAERNDIAVVTEWQPESTAPSRPETPVALWHEDLPAALRSAPSIGSLTSIIE